MADKLNFNFKKSAVYQAVRLAQNPVFRLAKNLKKIILILFIFVLLSFAYLFLTDTLGQKIQALSLGLSIILLVLFLFFWAAESFFNSKIKKPRLDAKISEVLPNLEKYNLADFLSFEVARALSDAVEFCRKNKVIEINSTLLCYFLLLNNKSLDFIFFRALLSVKETKQFFKNYLELLKKNSRSRGGEESKLGFSQDFQELILESLKKAGEKNHSRIEKGDLLIGLARHDSIFRKILIDNDLRIEDIENLVSWLEYLEKKEKESKRFWEWKNLIKKGSLGKEWTAGHTLVLDQFSIDLSELVKKKGFPEIIGHKKETKTMERVLSRREINNALVVGELGSGRRSMLYALASRSVLGESLPEVNYKRVVQLDLPTLLAQIESAEKIEAVLDNIFKEVIGAGNIILVIDDFHNFVGGASRPGTIDISGILTPYLNYPDFQIVAITSFEGFHKNIEQNSSLLSLFERVEVFEISERETLILLENLGLVLEGKYKKFISYPALRDIITHCSKYLPAIAFPEKAMDLLDEAMVYLAQTKDRILLPGHIAHLVSEKTQIPVGKMEIKEKQTLLNLEKLIHQRIVNQEEAVREVATALRRARAEIAVRSGPIGTFLFLGPTGVGKTETSKALAETYFGSEEKMIRLDMSEFQNVADISRLIGGPGEEGLLTTEIKERPFSLILLDEIEKAHPNILNLFLQVLDEGRLTDGLGRKVDFKNSIIIATSNAGYQIILKALKEKTEWSEVKQILLDYLFQEGLFRPEFINRFDAMVVFQPLSRENLLEIADLMLGRLKKNLEKKEIELVVSQALKEKIVELGYDPTFGARQMKRVIQDKVENVLAQAVLSGQIKRGYKAEVNPKDFSLIVL